MKSTTPLDTNKLIQFLTTPEMWDSDECESCAEWAEAHQLLINKIRNGDFDLTWPNSTQMIGNAKERFDQLSRKEFDWHSWYNGWMEGRFDLIGGIMGKEK